MADLVQRLEPFPTLVKGRRWDVLAANPAARELFADWAAGPPGERNLVRWMFTTDQAREVYLEWEPEARAMLGRFRLAAARYPDDPDVRALIAELQRDSEHVRDWWPRHDVAAIGGSGTKKLRHPRLGPVEYSHVVLQVGDQPGPDPGHLLPPREHVSMRLDLSWRTEDGERLPMALWHPGPGYRMISTGVLGGGLGPREWVLNAQVPAAYARTDPAEHLRELARGLHLTGPGSAC